MRYYQECMHRILTVGSLVSLRVLRMPTFKLIKIYIRLLCCIVSARKITNQNIPMFFKKQLTAYVSQYLGGNFKLPIKPLFALLTQNQSIFMSVRTSQNLSSYTKFITKKETMCLFHSLRLNINSSQFILM